MKIKVFDYIDETMEINHQIMNYIISIADADLNRKIKKENIGVKDIEENKIIKMLFERLQEQYRKIEDELRKYEELEEEMEIFEMESVYPDVKQLQQYVVQSYNELDYMPIYDDNGVVIEKCIYSGTRFEHLRYTEYGIQLANLYNIHQRMNFNNQNKNLNFKEKSFVLTELARKRFYDEYAFKGINTYIETLKNYIDKPNTIDEMDGSVETVKTLLEEMYQQKYILIHKYLQDKYNGIFQVNDKGKTGMIKGYLDLGFEGLALNNMEKDEIEAVVNKRLEHYVTTLDTLLNEVVKNGKRRVNSHKNAKKLEQDEEIEK